MATKRFLSVGDLLINPDLLAYATFEQDADGPRLRLGFAASGASAMSEVRLSGSDAGVALRWLRLNATSLTQEGAFGSIGLPIERSLSGHETEDLVINQRVLASAIL